MGTRGLLKVISKKKVKVAQYNNFDSYPDGKLGLGVKIAKFIQNIMKFEIFQEKIDKLEFSFFEENEIPNIKPYNLDGYDMLNYIQNEEHILVASSLSFENDKLYCEWVYTLDLDEKTVTVSKNTNYFTKIVLPFDKYTEDIIPNIQIMFKD